MKTERLDKVLSKSGFGTRSEVKKLVRRGLVLLNGEPCKSADRHIDLMKDSLEVDGEKIDLRTDLYLMMNKCKNVVCAAKDGLHDTVFSLLDEDLCHDYVGGSLHLVGRLDLDTEGLLIFTTDGTLTHRVTSPKTHISKTYEAELLNAVSPSEQLRYIEAFRKGVVCPAENSEEAFTALPAELSFMNPDENGNSRYARLVIYEGKYHQVKRMFRGVGNEVTELKRTGMGALRLDPSLLPGEYRELTEDEITLLYE